MMKLTDSNVTIMTADMNAAIAFYESIGLKLKDRWGDHYAMLSGPGVTIGLHPSEHKSHSSGTVSVGLMIENVDDARALLKDNGIKFEEASGKSGHFFNFADRDGTALYFMKPAY